MKLLRKKNGQWLTVSVAVGGLLLGANSISARASEGAADLDETNQSAEYDASLVQEAADVEQKPDQAGPDLGNQELDDSQPEYIEASEQQEPKQEAVEDAEPSLEEDEKPAEPELKAEPEVKEEPAEEKPEADLQELDEELLKESDQEVFDQKEAELDSNKAVEDPQQVQAESPDEEQPATHRNELVNLDQTWADGYRGEGQIVAIIDSGLYVDHSAFAPLSDVERARYRTEEELEQAKAAAGIDYGRWYSDKIIFGHNYNDVNEELLEVEHASHGTHVADSAVGNPENPLNIGSENQPNSQFYVHGVAPEAQLMFMRVFSDDNNPGSTNEYLYVQAIEDAVALGAQSINLSLGAPGGSQYNTSGVLDRAIAEARRQGVSVVIAAGNENTFGNGHHNPRAENPDYGLVGTPSTSRDSISVAAVDSLWLVNEVMNVVDQDGNVTNLRFNIVANGGQDTLETPEYAGQEFEYEYVGLGTAEDVVGVDLTGKFALISRGGITFTEKAQNAQRAGAAGVIIFNNDDDGTMINMAIDGLQGLPIIGTTYESGQFLVQNQDSHRVSFTGETLQFDNPNAGNLTSFTSWGLSADGELKPDLAAPGGNVYGAVNNNDYQNMSGTSMASPHVAGAVALLNQRLPDLYEELEGEALSNLVKALLMSSARPHYNVERGAFTSPRQQGAGLIDVDNALSSGIYLTGADNYPSISLRNVGDRFEFDINVYNISNEDKVLDVTTHLATDAVENALLGTTFSLEPRHLKDVPEGQVYVAANTHETVTISVDAREFAQALSADMPNGYYLEGFVSFGTELDPLLSSIPFVGFRGDFANLDVVEQSVYEYGFDFTEDLSDAPFYYVDLATGNPTQDYTSLISVEDNSIITLGEDTVLNFGSGEEVTFAISPNNDQTKDLVAFRGVFLRNYEDFTASVYSLNELGEEELVWVSGAPASGVKNFYDGNPLRPKSSIVLSSIWEGQDMNGNIVADGLYRYDVSLRSQVPGSLSQLLSFNIHVSTTTPEVTAADFNEETRELSLREVNNLYPGLNPYRTRILVGDAPDPLMLALGLVNDTREEIFLTGHGTNTFVIPEHVDVYASNAVLHLEDYAGNSFSILLSDILHGQSGVVEFKLTDAQTGEDLTGAGLRVRIRDAEGNIVSGDRLVGLNNQNIRRLPYGEYTAELFLMNEEYLELVNEPVQSFVVTEDNPWQTVEFLVNYIERVDFRIELNEALPEGAAIYLVNSDGEAILVPATSYVNTVHQVRLRAGEYTLQLELPEGYVSEQDGQVVTVDPQNTTLSVVIERELVDKSELGALIEYTQGLDRSGLAFTDNFIIDLLLDEAIEVYEDPEALQNEVDEIANALSDFLASRELLDNLAAERDAAKDQVSNLGLLTADEVADYHSQIDLAESSEAISAVVADAQALQAEREAEEAAAEALALRKADAVDEVNALDSLTEDRKAEIVEDINAAESIEAVDNIVAAAVAEDEEARAEAERLAALNQAKAEASEVLANLENISDEERLGFENRLEEAETIEEVEAVVADAQRADELALERAENERIEQLIAERALEVAKDSARNVVSQLSALSEEQVAEFNEQVDAATLPEEVNAVVDAALAANNEALATEQAEREADHQEELERKAQEAAERVLEVAKDSARNVVNQLSALSEEQVAEFNEQVDGATSPEEVNAVVNAALAANSEALAEEQAEREAEHQAELERKAQEAAEREAALQAELDRLEQEAQEAEEREKALQAELDQAKEREAALEAERDALLAELEEAKKALEDALAKEDDADTDEDDSSEEATLQTFYLLVETPTTRITTEYQAETAPEAELYFRNYVNSNGLGDLNWNYSAETNLFHATAKAVPVDPVENDENQPGSDNGLNDQDNSNSGNDNPSDDSNTDESQGDTDSEGDDLAGDDNSSDGEQNPSDQNLGDGDQSGDDQTDTGAEGESNSDDSSAADDSEAGNVSDDNSDSLSEDADADANDDANSGEAGSDNSGDANDANQAQDDDADANVLSSSAENAGNAESSQAKQNQANQAGAAEEASQQAQGETLPQTATSMWATALLGLTSLSTGLFVGKKKEK